MIGNGSNESVTPRRKQAQPQALPPKGPVPASVDSSLPASTSAVGSTDWNIRQPAHQIDPRAIAYWRTSALIGVLVLTVVGAAMLLIPDVGIWLAGGVLFLAALALGAAVVIPARRYRVHRWEITPTAVHTRSGWIVREDRIAPLSRVQTVDSHQGALMRLFKLRNVTVTTASAAGPIVIQLLDEEYAQDVVAELTALTRSTTGDAT